MTENIGAVTMNNIKTLRIALGALLHDVGKLAQFAASLPDKYREDNAQLYQPEKNGRFTHSHALYTAYFIENMEKFIPEPLLFDRDGKNRDADSLINLAAKHHKPDTPSQWIIAEADRLSSGIDRDEFPDGKDIPVSDAVKTRLIPIFEMLFSDEKSPRNAFLWRYPLAPVSATSIFPEKNGSEAKDEDYRRVYGEFIGAFQKLAHRSNPVLWLQHCDSLYRTFTSHIPAARVGRVIHDVSLYDHSRSTAALAVALYRYHEETNSFEESAIRDRSEKKFLIVSGDFYGIQSFIFSAGGEERGYRSKLLRGRSFTVSLLVELAAHEISKELDLSPLSIVMATGGKFHLFAHNTEKSRRKIEKVATRLNDWLIDVFCGECAIGISTTELSAGDFLDGKFQEIWSRHLEAMEERKYRRFDLRRVGGVRKDFLDRFRNDLYRPLCPLCGRRPSEEKVENDRVIARPNERASACGICRDHVLMGTKIVKGNRIAITTSKKGDLATALFGNYQVEFLEAEKGKMPAQDVEKFWDVNIKNDGSVPCDVTFMPLNGYVPVYEEKDEYDDRILAGYRSEEKKLELIDMIREGVPRSFYHIASTALSFGDRGDLYGVDALGVLKADVDHLGALFSCGFQGRRFTLSRLATFSRILNNFFALYLPYALRNENKGAFRNTYTVFAGGDDLFLIGPWNKTRDLAIFIADKFKTYACENPKVHLSAGITVHKPSTPMDVIAEESEEALGLAKALGRNRVTMFYRTVTWDEFKDLVNNIMPRMERWLTDGWFSRSLFHRLLTFVDMAELEKRVKKAIQQGRSFSVSDIESFKWRAFLRYYIVRNVAKNISDKTALKETHQILIESLAKWLDDYGGAMIIPLWSILYETRKKRGQ
jgi:CRISPR-associated protein Csm1